MLLKDAVADLHRTTLSDMNSFTTRVICTYNSLTILMYNMENVIIFETCVKPSNNHNAREC